MAKSRGVWGIDIGQSALKALRCHLNEDGEVVVDSYDYIEYPKALSLPDADEEALIRDALGTFLSRNDLHGDFVGMSVSGQSGLSRFFKPPPVDAKTLPDIVKYEVKQQIPFPIEDVIWDWQSLGGTEMDEVMVDAEVGLFAIKRETVFAALQPFLQSDIEVDLVQMSPLAIHNVVCHDILENVGTSEEVDQDNLPDSVVVLSMGTDATDLIVTNGIKLWLRNIPIGGNHFTKQLSRDLKLTHAKAEHLKRNARQAEDPKTVFQAMRPVFNDLVTEIQRSLSYYAGMEKNAKISRIVLLGNAAKLPGLRQYLNKQLELDIVKVAAFRHLTGSIVEEKTFSDNLLSFAPSYGLCLQGVQRAHVDTNLLPQEFVTDRVIRAKKPWVLASVGVLMLGMLLSYFFYNQRWREVHNDYSVGGVTWEQAKLAVEDKERESGRFKTTDDEQKTKLEQINMISSELAEASDSVAIWPELITAFRQLMPRDPRIQGGVADPMVVPYQDREEIYIDYVETKLEANLADWQEGIVALFRDQQGITNMETRTETYVTDDGFTQTREIKPPAEYDVTGAGWVIEIGAHHFYNSEEKLRLSQHGRAFVLKNVLTPLVNGTVKLPGANGELEDFKLEDLGVYYATLIAETPMYNLKIPNPKFGERARESEPDPSDPDAPSGEEPQDPEEAEIPEFFEVMTYEFVIQLAWFPTTPQDRVAARDRRLQEEAKENAAAAGAAPAGQQVAPTQPAQTPPSNDPGGAANADQQPDPNDATDTGATDPNDTSSNPGDQSGDPASGAPGDANGDDKSSGGGTKK